MCNHEPKYSSQYHCFDYPNQTNWGGSHIGGVFYKLRRGLGPGMDKPIEPT